MLGTTIFSVRTLGMMILSVRTPGTFSVRMLGMVILSVRTLRIDYP